jgi:hypothetical protein
MSDGNNFLGNETSSILEEVGLSDVEIINDWMQLGNETYLTDFVAHDSNGEDVHFVAKACIKYFPVETMDEWIMRRELLVDSDVKVPILLTRQRALIIEEFIPYSFREAYAMADEEQKRILQQEFIDTYKRVSGAGFGPFSLHDARSHGNDVLLVDMGEDIGAPKKIDRCNLSISKLAIEAFYRISDTKPSYE